MLDDVLVVERLVNFIEQKWKSKNCLLCDANDFVVQDSIFYLFNNESMQLPVIPITCNNCGNTNFINALKAGIIKKEVEEEIVNKQ